MSKLRKNCIPFWQMNDVFYRYLTCQLTSTYCFSTYYFLFIKFGVIKIGFTVSSSKISWAVLLCNWTTVTFLKSYCRVTNMCWMNVTYMTGEMEYSEWIKNEFDCLFSKRTMTIFDFIKNFLFMENVMASCPN